MAILAITTREQKLNLLSQEYRFHRLEAILPEIDTSDTNLRLEMQLAP